MIRAKVKNLKERTNKNGGDSKINSETKETEVIKGVNCGSNRLWA